MDVTCMELLDVGFFADAVALISWIMDEELTKL